MIFKHFAYAIEVVFFIFLIFDGFYRERREGESSLKLRYSFLIPACLSLFLLLTDIFFSAVSLTMPAIDILCSLLLMLLLRSYTVSGKKLLLVLSIFLVLFCVTSGVVRVAGVLTESHNDVYRSILFYPLIPLLFMMLYVLISVGDFLKGVNTHFFKLLKTEDILIHMLIVSAFFFILFFALWVTFLRGEGRHVFSSGISVLALSLYYFRYDSYAKSALVGCRGDKASAMPFPQEICLGEQTQKNILLQELYGRILELFEAEKPYLNDGITVSDIAKMLYSNKVYVSRAINDSTGKNFCQFVNHYRIMYAVSLFKENPYLKIGDLSDMSGFHSQVSFNMAFRLVMGEVPGEWCKKMRVEMNSKHKKS